MRFTLFGIPTEVHGSFWFGAVLLGLNDVGFLPVWVLIVFFSVMIHELGHALSIRAFGLRPEISLQWLGGLTSWSGGRDLSRPKRVFISFAGPLAGFVFAGVGYAVLRLRPDLVASLGAMPLKALLMFQAVNLYWGVINLAPVLPLDGGHMLEHTLGPKRARLTAGLSTIFGIACAVAGYSFGGTWLAFLFGMLALQSFQRYQAESPDPTPRATPVDRRPIDPPLSPELERELKRASDALEAERFDEARTIANAVLTAEPARNGRIRALETIAWAFLLEGQIEEATRAVRSMERHGKADAALAGGVLFARRELAAARAVFEAARAVGDDRKEVVGPLIQILIEEGEVARAAAIALDIAETLSDDDLRQMATIAAQHAAFSWAARLHESLFDRTEAANDAYEAARAKALDGDRNGTLAWLTRAKERGFDDAAKLWSEAAFAKLRDEAQAELTAILPRPEISS
jgi:Zn-dependent protease/thioredoxin-like negative regulator of GroEL